MKTTLIIISIILILAGLVWVKENYNLVSETEYHNLRHSSPYAETPEQSELIKELHERYP